jgi:hypothetical protein
MAVSVSATDTTGQSNVATGVTSFTYTGLTTLSGDTDLVVFVAWDGLDAGGVAPTSPSAHWDSTGSNQAMTLVGGLVQTDGEAGGVCSIFYLASPAVGNKTLSVSWTNSCLYVVSAMSFQGGGSQSNSAGGITASVGGNFTASATSASGNYVVGCFGSALTTFGWGTTTSGTKLANGGSSTTLFAWFMYATGASPTMAGTLTSSSSGNYAHVVCNITAAGGPPPFVTKYRYHKTIR